MKKTRLSVLTAIIFSSIFVASCSGTFLEPSVPEAADTGSSHLKLRLTGDVHSKSSISPDEGLVKDICVMVYRSEDGKLIGRQDRASAEEIDLELPSGNYNIYVTANMGEFSAPVNESDIGQATYKVNSFSEMDKALPMCWKGSAEIRPGQTTTVSAGLSRLVSRVGLRIDMGALEGLIIKSVRLYQGAGVLRPFMKDGSRVLKPNETMNGDFATDYDISRLMAGEDMFFYVTENCQGTLLPYNKNPWNKVPDNLGAKSLLCTYLEMQCKWSGDAAYEGNVTYRFYLGENAESNFDIKRNSIHDLLLYLEEESLDKLNWKIDTSLMGPSTWDAYSSLENNCHKDGEFHVTENIRVDLTLDAKGQKYWNKRGNDFSLAGLDGSGNTIIRFDKPTDCGNGKFIAMGTCIAQGSYDIVMIDNRTGRSAYVLQSGTVHLPEIRAEYDNGGFMINGSICEIRIFLTDRNGVNLNGKEYYGCDLNSCDWKIGITNETYGYGLTENIDIEEIVGVKGSGSYAVCYRLRFDNDGRNEAWNRKLSESLGQDKIILTCNELWSGAEGKHPMGLYCDDIEVTFMPVPDDKKATMQTEFMYLIDNPSNLPIKIRGLKMNSLKSSPKQDFILPVLGNAASGHVSSEHLIVSPMPYTICSMDDRAAAHISWNGKTGYAADDSGIGQTDIPDQKAMFHTFEAELAYGNGSWSPKFNGRTDLYDTPAHSALYGSQGYVNCGIILHTDDGRQELYDSNNSTGKFDLYGDILNRESIKRFNELIVVDITINEANEIIATSSRAADLRVSVSGKLNGHIRCVTVQDPFFTVWGHYFTHSQNFSNTGTYKVGSTSTMIDGGVLADSYVQMRSIPYYSILDAWDIDEFIHPYTMTGTIREYLKPYGLEINLEITSTDGTPVAVRFSGSSKYNYTNSEPVTWYTGLFSTATMVPSEYSGFDNRLDDDDCPPGELFKEETVTLTPTITYSNHKNIFHLSL